MSSYSKETYGLEMSSESPGSSAVVWPSLFNVSLNFSLSPCYILHSTPMGCLYFRIDPTPLYLSSRRLE